MSPTIFRLDASIRTEGSVTRAVADTLEAGILEDLGPTDVVRRDVGSAPLDAAVWGAAAFAGFTPEESATTTSGRPSRSLPGWPTSSPRPTR